MTDKLMKKCKFDYIIQNPPYDGALHLDFLTMGLDLLNVEGKMTIIEPASWLINIRKNGNAKKYDEIKKRIDSHIESVVIENFNKNFGTETQVPFATTTINMSKTFKTIKFSVCGEKRIVDSVYDCNLIGKYDTVWSIFNKIGICKDMMSNHTTNTELSGDVWYAKYAEIGRCGCSSGDRAHLDSYYYGEVFKYFYFNGYDNRDEISNHPLKVKDGGNKDTDKNANCVYGSKKEMENWAYFNMNNKLPLFINICLTIDQHNNSKQFMPWLVDKQYTDEEINHMFGFSEEEKRLIDTTIKKYERNSPWFKRYMCGPDSATDQEVMDFMNAL